MIRNKIKIDFYELSWIKLIPSSILSSDIYSKNNTCDVPQMHSVSFFHIIKTIFYDDTKLLRQRLSRNFFSVYTIQEFGIQLTSLTIDSKSKSRAVYNRFLSMIELFRHRKGLLLRHIPPILLRQQRMIRGVLFYSQIRRVTLFYFTYIRSVYRNNFLVCQVFLFTLI